MKDISDLYDVKPAPRSLMEKIPKRKRPARPYPLLTAHQAEYVMQNLMKRFGYDEYLDSWSFEMRKRTIPYVSTDERPRRVADKFKMYGPHIMDAILPQIKLKKQTYNKVSALGWPINKNPNAERKSEAPEDPSDWSGILNELRARLTNTAKRNVLFDEFFTRFDAGDFSGFEEQFNTGNTRGQPESPDKIRELPFISADGSVYLEDVDRRKYAEPIRSLSDKEKVPLRHRLVVNASVINLYLQVWDTQVHSYLISHPISDSNMYTRMIWDRETFVTFDCKHYERTIGMIVPLWAELVGGEYGQQLMAMATAPYLLPADDWKSCWFVRPKIGPGKYMQLGSGLSVVATIGKLANLAVAVGYYVEIKKLPIKAAIEVAFAGEYDGMRRWAFGDDNRLTGDAGEIERFLEYVGDHFDIELDEKPQYLGFVWRSDLHRWMLRNETYIVKGGLRERDYSFYTFPFLGQIERRNTFREFGEPIVAEQVMPYEDALYADLGESMHSVATKATQENMIARELGVMLTREMVTDKDYLLTDEQKLASGLSFELPLERVAHAVKVLVGKSMQEKLNL